MTRSVPRPARRPSRLLRDDRGRVDIRSLSMPALEALVVEAGGKPSRALAIHQWLWQRGAQTFDEMHGVSQSLRQRLEALAYIPQLQTHRLLESADGTTKFLWKLEDGHIIESVLIPDEDRLTLCVSSQVGCAMGCTFCLTGDMGLIRHLKPSEIANQPLQVQAWLAGGAIDPSGRSDIPRITNLVFMGMGEPLHNLENLLVALRICLSDHGLRLSHRKITVSTVGLVPKMAELAAALPVNLAVSLNATTEAQRLQIMPITRRHSMAELLEGCRTVPLPHGKRITFEYVMLRGFNDSLEDAARLFDLLQGIPAKVNLIPYNENPDRDLQRPSPETVKAFQHFLVSRGLATHVRTTRGIDISAACGQLGKAGAVAAGRGA